MIEGEENKPEHKKSKDRKRHALNSHAVNLVKN